LGALSEQSWIPKLDRCVMCNAWFLGRQRNTWRLELGLDGLGLEGLGLEGLGLESLGLEGLGLEG
jgi:hypothetical protein